MKRQTSLGSTALLTGLMSLALASPGAADEALLEQACSACHTTTEAGLSRIAGQRKTPEGWMMTIVRMQQSHGLEISAEDRRAIVRHLADTQGLAPAEAAPFRYALEKDPNVVEAQSETVGPMCARCHTEARVGLQRRTAEEWSLVMDFHVGNYPTIEYSAGGRDREWFRIAKEEIAPYLAQTHGFDDAAWSDWQAREKASVAGDWIVLAEMPRGGRAYGTLKVTRDSSPYRVSGTLRDATGRQMAVSGTMNLYTGYEWRATLDIGGETYRQVLAVSEDGKTLEGRQFLRATDSLGGHLSGVRADQSGVVLGTVPAAVPAGSATVQVVGAGLDRLGASAGTLAVNADGAALTLETSGNGTVTFTGADGAPGLAHYASIDSLVVEPAFTIARVGGGGDMSPGVVPAHFRAVGMWNGPDGAPGTDDDLRIGEIAADWTVENLHDTAAQMQDAAFAGEIDDSGLFTPAIAGPNPERRYSTNNAGELRVTADALGQSGDATLIVTVQRFIDPPIR